MAAHVCAHMPVVQLSAGCPLEPGRPHTRALCAPWHRCGGHCGLGRITGCGVPVSAICAGAQASHVLKASGGAKRRGEPHVHCLSCLEHRILPADTWEPGLCPRPEAGRGLGQGELEQGPAAPPGLQLVGVGNKSRAVPPHPSVCRSSVQQPFDSGFPDKPRAKPREEAGWGGNQWSSWCSGPLGLMNLPGLGLIPKQWNCKPFQSFWGNRVQIQKLPWEVVRRSPVEAMGTLYRVGVLPAKGPFALKGGAVALVPVALCAAQRPCFHEAVPSCPCRARKGCSLHLEVQAPGPEGSSTAPSLLEGPVWFTWDRRRQPQAPAVGQGQGHPELFGSPPWG